MNGQQNARWTTEPATRGTGPPRAAAEPGSGGLSKATMAGEQLLYDLLERLDRLEELREDWLEALQTGASPEQFDPEFLHEMQALGVARLDDIERRMASLHAEVDALDAPDGRG